MTFLAKSGSAILLLLSLVLSPVICTAQQNTFPDPDTSDVSESDSLAGNVQLFRNKESTVVTNMPVYNPKTDAKILILRPPEDIAFNMPILGYKDSSPLRVETFNSDSLHSPYPEKPEE